MSIDMYLAAAKTQATGAAAMGKSHVQGYEALQKAAQNFANDTVLEADAYTSAKGMFGSVILPLTQAGQLLSETVAEACKKFPEDYTAQVDSGDLKSSELEEKIQRLNNEIQALYSIRSSIEAKDTADNMKIRQLNSNKTAIACHEAVKKKLEEQLQKLLDFHASSPSLFSEITTLTNAVNQGSAIAGKSWHAASGTFKLPEGTDMSWTKDVNNRWENRQFAKKYEVERPKDMNAKEYQEYLKTLREQKQVLCKEDGWDEEAFKAYMKHVNKKLGSGGKNVFDRLNQINVETRLVGSDVYRLMFSAYGTVDGKIPAGMEQAINEKRMELLMKQMGGEIDVHGMLQMTGTHKFDPNMPPHGDFLHTLAKTVQEAYPKGLLEGYSNMSREQKQFVKSVHQLRMYIDKNNLEYIRRVFKSGANAGRTDEEALYAYVHASIADGGLGGELMIAEKGRLHNKYLKDTTYDKSGDEVNRKRLAPDFHSEFILDPDGNFISQWNVLDEKDGLVISDPEYYRNKNAEKPRVYEQQLMDGESYNYGDKNDKVHELLDSKPPGKLDHDVRKEIKDEWESPKNREEYNWNELENEDDGYSIKGKG
ncbi:DUF3114 domain-containing protein [Enterococcus sp. BWR-S5]|uniref:DUF3114 domain-containing protein n=1 Tax=Enterococcus sp. BWR-S5 TaxID=2787714 RepID=UPI001922BF1D|nr:DUF3114 domain-containing protein [Enterococcus sp. BWR-S5]MBL1224142.1 DUF3114 domain-containing protein [Enterococcus sp. BWR-S5]